MILKSIKLTNFKCHEHFEAEFSTGITSIYGENGSGKSSILEAISWALFNFIPYSSIESVVMQGKKNAEVLLVIKSSIDNREYLIRRKSSSGVSAFVSDIQTGTKILEGVSKLDEWVKYQLNLQKDSNLKLLCKNGVGIPQGNLTTDFLAGNEERRKTFDSILGLDEYKTIDLKLREIEKFLEKDINKLEGALSEGENLEQDLNLLSGELESSSKIIEDQRKAISLKKIQLESLKKVLVYKEELINLSSQIDELESKVKRKNELEENALSYEPKKKDKKELSLKKAELDSLRNIKIQLDNVCEIASQNIKEINEQLEKLCSLEKELELVESKSSEFSLMKDKQTALLLDKVHIEGLSNRKILLINELKEISERLKIVIEILEELEKKEVSEEVINECESRRNELRLEFKRISDIERKIASKRAESQHEISNKEILNIRIKNISTELEETEKSLKLKEKERNERLARFKFNEEVLPKLLDDGICPIFQSSCSNLKASDNKLFTDMKDMKQEILLVLSQLEEEIHKKESLKTTYENEIKLLLELKELYEELGEFSSELIRSEGEKLSKELEILKKDYLLIQKKEELLNEKNLKTEKIELIKQEIKFIEENEEKLVLINKELSQIEASLEELKPIWERALIIKSELNKRDFLSQRRSEETERFIFSENKLKEINSKIYELKDTEEKLKALETELESLEFIYLEWNSLKDSEINLKEIKRQNDEIQANLNELKLILEKYNLTEQTLEKAKVLNTELEESLRLLYSHEGIFEEKTKTKKKLELKLEERKKRLEEFGSIRGKYELTGRLRIKFKEALKRLTGYYAFEIGRKASEMFSEIIDDTSCRISLSEDYKITVERSGRELPFELLSGGQQVAAAISVRLAILQELSNIKFAFFDEPTVNLDFERRNLLAQQISSIKSFEQLFVITHDESFAGLTKQSIILGRD